MSSSRPVAGALEAAAQSPQQLRYALLLQWGTRIGLAVLVASFLGYATGWLPAHLPPERLAQLWSQPVQAYLAASGSPTGWAWIRLAHHGDVMGLAGIAILAGCSVLSLLALVPLYAAARDRWFVALCLLQALVVLTAASGVYL
ncbi:MAG: hypothetical protein ACYC0T_12525 [Ramlibacter sp.]